MGNSFREIFGLKIFSIFCDGYPLQKMRNLTEKLFFQIKANIDMGL